MTLRIAVTRAQPGASRTAAALIARGVEPVVAPLLTIEATGAPPPGLGDIQAVLFTSANAVRCFAVAGDGKLALCVGAATAQAAAAAGFTAVSADRDGAALIDLASRELKPSAGVLLHVRGEDVAVDLTGALAAAGFSTLSHIAYRAAAATTLPGLLAESLAPQGAGLDGILFHSPRLAAIGARLLHTHAGRLAAAFISPAAEAAGSSAPWASVATATRPDDAALIEAALAQSAART